MLSASRNVEQIAAQARKFRPLICTMDSEEAARQLRLALAGEDIRIYGGADAVVPPKINCEAFAERLKAAGGEINVIRRAAFGHHPHGVDPNKTDRIVRFVMTAK